MNNDLYNHISASVKTNYQKELKNFGLDISRENAAGYRDHSNYKKNTYAASYNILINPANTLTLNTRYDELNLNNAGALTENLVNNNPRQSHPMYAKDYRNYKKFGGTLQYSRGNKNKLTILSGFRALQQKEIRTITNILCPLPGIHPLTTDPTLGRTTLEELTVSNPQEGPLSELCTI